MFVLEFKGWPTACGFIAVILCEEPANIYSNCSLWRRNSGMMQSPLVLQPTVPAVTVQFLRPSPLVLQPTVPAVTVQQDRVLWYCSLLYQL